MVMSEHPGGDEGAVDADTLEEWLDTIADRHGLSHEQVLDQLISSHWTLNELSRVMEQTEGTGEFGTVPGPGPRRTAGPGERGELEPTLSEQIGNLQDALERAAPESEASETRAELEEVRDELDGLRADLAALADRVGDLETTVEDGDDAPTNGEFWTLVTEFASFKETVTDRQDALDARMDEAFANLETILAHLVDSTESVEAANESLREEWHDHRRAIRKRREQLVALKREANSRGVTEADCESCGTTVDLGLLEEPACPHCQTAFDDIEPASGWVGLGIGSDVLTTTDRPLPETDIR